MLPAIDLDQEGLPIRLCCWNSAVKQVSCGIFGISTDKNLRLERFFVSMEERIRRVTNDLRALEEEMTRIAKQGVSSPEGAALVDELLTEDLVHEFKSSVDHMRLFLWSYIEAVSEGRGNEVQDALLAYRMRRVTEMLRVLEEPLRAGLPRPTQEATSFIEEISRIAGLALIKANLAK